MTASDLSDDLNAIAVLIGAIAVLVAVLGIGRRLHHISADVKGVKLQVDTELPEVKRVLGEEVAKPLKDVNLAVNHRAPHEPTLVGRITALENLPGQLDHLREQQERTATAVHEIRVAFDEFARSTTALQGELIRVVGIEVSNLKTKERP